MRVNNNPSNSEHMSLLNFFRRVRHKSPTAMSGNGSYETSDVNWSPVWDALAVGSLELAKERVELALSSAPASSEGQLLRVQVLYEQGHRVGAMSQLEILCNQENAQQALETVTHTHPDWALAHLALGLSLHHVGQLEEATFSFELAAHHCPSLAEAQYMLGTVARTQGHLDAAIDYYSRALVLCPDMFAAHADLGVCYQRSGRLSEARNAYTEALRLQPQDAQVLCNLALVLRDQGDFFGAMKIARGVLAADPGNVNAWCNLGLALMDDGDLDGAERALEQALAIRPDDADARWNRALCHLLRGEFRDGWRGYGLRWTVGKVRAAPYHFPEWNGTPLTDQRVLVYGEQGLGDEIMFSSCLEDVASQVSDVVVLCDKRLQPLLTRSFPKIEVVPRGDWADTSWLACSRPIHYQAAMGMLPGFFRNTYAEFPQRDSYLKPAPERVEHWRKIVNALPGQLKVGVSWRGGKYRTRQSLRSLPATQFANGIAMDGVSLVNLQYGDVTKDLLQLTSEGLTVHNFTDALVDYDETAALVAALDVVISVQTAVVHLAGALGKKTYVLVPVSPEWRYLRTGETMPWYKSVRLLRQAQVGNWTDVLQKAAGELRCSLNRV